jgi:Tfp pilus assembly protein PilN
MIQFNLLPDVKIHYLKARRQEQLVVVISTFATIAGIAIVVVLLGIVYGVQKKNLSDLNKDIKSNSQELQSTPNLNKILTVQSQLKALPGLHDQKAVATRLGGFLSQVTPSAVNISKLDVDFLQNTLVINGGADTLDTVNTFTDTLKFTTYTSKGSSAAAKPAFSNVVLTNFSRDKKGATYTITTSFDPSIFNETDDVTLNVPSIISTRSAVEKPTALFQGSTSTGSGQ